MRRSHPYESAQQPQQVEIEHSQCEDLNAPQPNSMPIPIPEFHSNQAFSVEYNDYFPKRNLPDYFLLGDPIPPMFNHQYNEQCLLAPEEAGRIFSGNNGYGPRDIFAEGGGNSNPGIMQMMWHQCPPEFPDVEVKREQQMRDAEDHFEPEQKQWQPNLEVKGQPIDDLIQHYIYPQGMHDKCNPSLAKIEKLEEWDFENPEKSPENRIKSEKQIQFWNSSKKPGESSLRRQKVLRYLEKKHNRNFCKKITYQCRKEVADKRIRWKGRFINYKQAVSELGLYPNREYEVQYLKEMIRNLEDNGHSVGKLQKIEDQS